MKKILTATAVAAALAAGNAQAATNLTGTFSVDVTLTSKCSMSAISNVAFTYTSFGALANATGGAFTVTCTNTLPYTMTLQSGTGGTAPGTATITVTDNAVNLQYTLGLSAAGGTGNGVAQSFNVTGTMAAGQAGTCATSPATCSNAAATNRTHTLYVSY